MTSLFWELFGAVQNVIGDKNPIKPWAKKADKPPRETWAEKRSAAIPVMGIEWHTGWERRVSQGSTINSNTQMLIVWYIYLHLGQM